MVLGGGHAVIGQRMVRVGFGADAALMLEGKFKDGEKDGLWTFYNKKGLKEKEVTYDSGKEIKQIIKWRSGDAHQRPPAVSYLAPACDACDLRSPAPTVIACCCWRRWMLPEVPTSQRRQPIH